jgi:hypothetical protein
MEDNQVIIGCKITKVKLLPATITWEDVFLGIHLNRNGTPQSTYFTVRGQSYLISLVFQNIDPPPPSHPPLRPASLSSPSNKGGGGYTLAGRRGRWGVNILEDERNKIGLLQ